ncbi:Putative PLC-like phosphodiesterase, TIM beta/alpha-barrel domain superfamily [Septoria linicola]|uniref:PLC-like phosphodiesterase, TIM beta/alpha-barrel domain superfamily n=1 Tax=Septoria linicola TaxID=215465 RepID=A0A9Q9AR46_9PEZI|nr:Putative PLC-like phosphodiesterase, TIM beta/alpha-barrel domain superfamily [Septoria linicola]
MRLHTILPLAVSFGFHHGTVRAQSDASGRQETADQLRLNQIQVIGTHNSYHREVALSERKVLESYIPGFQDLYYSHSILADQLNHQQVRSFELDLHSDEEGGLYANPLIWKLSNLTTGPNGTAPFDNTVMLQPGLKVFHITDVDTNAICHTFTDCLTQAKAWSDANPNHLPLTFDLELKNDAFAASLGGVSSEEATNFTLPRILNVDAEILSILPRDKLITPDDVRHEGMTLEASILQYGWPTLSSSRGKFLFFFDNDPSNSTSDIRTLYRSDGHESLQNRTVFTNAVEGDEDCAFIKYNNPDIREIQRLVKKGYLVRTRADEPISTILSRNTTMRENALASGAQIVSTDFPVFGMSARWARDYAVQFSRGRVARCNHVSAPGWCRDDMVQE